jgi:hypothetical protein
MPDLLPDRYRSTDRIKLTFRDRASRRDRFYYSRKPVYKSTKKRIRADAGPIPRCGQRADKVI